MLQTGRETSPASDRYDMKAHHRQTTVSSNECVRDLAIFFFIYLCFTAILNSYIKVMQHFHDSKFSHFASNFSRWGKRLILDPTHARRLSLWYSFVWDRSLVRSLFDSLSWEAGAKLSFQSIWDICQSQCLYCIQWHWPQSTPFTFLAHVWVSKTGSCYFLYNPNKQFFLITEFPFR